MKTPKFKIFDKVYHMNHDFCYSEIIIREIHINEYGVTYSEFMGGGNNIDEHMLFCDKKEALVETNRRLIIQQYIIEKELKENT